MRAWFILSVLEKNWQHRNLFLTAEMNFDFGFHVVNFRELYHGLSNILKIYCQLLFFSVVPSLSDLSRDAIYLVKMSHKSELPDSPPNTWRSKSWWGRNVCFRSIIIGIAVFKHLLLSFNVFNLPPQVQRSNEFWKEREETIWSKLINAN